MTIQVTAWLRSAKILRKFHENWGDLLLLRRIVVREFVLQSCYYVHFRANTLGKGINLLILPAMG